MISPKSNNKCINTQLFQHGPYQVHERGRAPGKGQVSHTRIQVPRARECIDQDYAKSCGFKLIKLTQPIPVYNVDGTLDNDGSITKVVSLILHYKNHLEKTTLAVTGLGGQKLLLGHSWVQKHNPEIDWAKGKVRMSRCPLQCCSGCRDELQQERIKQKAEAKSMDTCSVGPLPEIDHDSDYDSDSDLGSVRATGSWT